MKDILPIAAIALLLAANKKTTGYKPPIRVTYDCFRGCNWRVGGDCWSRDYDWTVTAEIPQRLERTYGDKEAAEVFIRNFRWNYSDADVINPTVVQIPNPDYQKCLDSFTDGNCRRYLYTASFWTYLWPDTLPIKYWAATSVSWDYNNPQSFYAEQASKMVEKAYDTLKQVHPDKVIDLSDYSIDVSYTKDFNECAEKDMKLDMLVGFVEQYLVDYLVRQYIPV